MAAMNGCDKKRSAYLLTTNNYLSRGKMEYVLGGLSFASKAQIKAHAQNILRTRPEGQPLGSEDFSFVYELLLMHPDAQSKIGVGVHYIKPEKHLPFSKNCGFTICRVNGTFEDFSYKACLQSKATSDRLAVTSAFRVAVVDQVQSVKMQLIAINQ